jgi:dihydroorotate dehydrogenase (NAD+) catalytic subunit
MGAHQSMTIDLAPQNPYGLILDAPVIVAPGCGSVLRHPDPQLIGAIATTTAMLRPSHLGHTRWGAVPAGVVFERLPAISYRSLLQSEARRWPRSPIPILLSLAGTADELAHLAEQLETLEGIAGVMIQSDEADPAVAVAAVRSQTPLPLLAVMPHPVMVEASLGAVAGSMVAAGADALVASAYPRGSAVTGDEIVDGFVVGPTLIPWTLRAIGEIVGSVAAPVIALGGVGDARLAQLCISAGASALMIDGALYGDPAAPQLIGAAVQRKIASDAASA